MPSLLPGFEYDIFISYRHNDNRSGWVTEFVKALQEELAATIKEPVSVYFDSNPHDGLLETHDVDDSLKEKLKCLIFIPVISQTYCDPKSFAWKNEFMVFLNTAADDSVGLKVKLPNGNTASRVLPIRIHELDAQDKKIIEAELGPLRAIDFTYQSAGVNRPLTAKDDESTKSLSQNIYRDQINKTANAIKEIIAGLQGRVSNDSSSENFEIRKEPPTGADGARKSRQWKPRVPRINKVFGLSLALVGSLLALIALAIFHYTETPPDNRVIRLIITPPSNTEFLEAYGGHFALSTDGKLMVFAARDSAGKDRLWVRPLNRLTAQALNGTENARYPFWSPDSRFIGFFADGKLRKIEASGGPVQIICDAPSGRGGTWNENGTIVFCPDIAVVPLSRVSDAGGVPGTVTKLDANKGQQSHRWPFFLPDGEHFLYCVRNATGTVSDKDAIYIASLDTTFIPHAIASSGSSVAYANGQLIFTRNQTLMAQPFDIKQLNTTENEVPIAEEIDFKSISGYASFSVSANGILAYMTLYGGARPNLTWYDRTGATTGVIPARFAIASDMSISPDAKKVATTGVDANLGSRDIWVYEIGRKIWTRATFGNASEKNPRWSPNGDTIVYAAGDAPRFSLFTVSSNGGGSKDSLLETDGNMSPNDWSKDRRFMVYNVIRPPKNQFDLWILPMTTKLPRKPFPFLETVYNERQGAFSPDSRWLAYESDESGQFEVYIRPFPGPGSKVQVSINGGRNAHWSDNGKEIFYASEVAIMTAEIKSGPSRIEVGTVRQLFKAPRNGGPDYDVTGDGQHFLLMGLEGKSIPPPITLVVNWPEEINKK